MEPFWGFDFGESVGFSLACAVPGDKDILGNFVRPSRNNKVAARVSVVMQTQDAKRSMD